MHNSWRLFEWSVSLILRFCTQNLLILFDLYISDGWRIWESLKGGFFGWLFFVCGCFFLFWFLVQVCFLVFWVFLRILMLGYSFCLVAKMISCGIQSSSELVCTKVFFALYHITWVITNLFKQVETLSVALLKWEKSK